MLTIGILCSKVAASTFVWACGYIIIVIDSLVNSFLFDFSVRVYFPDTFKFNSVLLKESQGSNVRTLFKRVYSLNSPFHPFSFALFQPIMIGNYFHSFLVYLSSVSFYKNTIYVKILCSNLLFCNTYFNIIF